MSYRAGYCGLIGLPNAGKSSLMNWLCKEKLSIVTAKPQTTRRRVLGLWSSEQSQVVFVDAPGLIRSEGGLNAFLQKEAEDVIANSDALLFVLNVDQKEKDNIENVIKLALTTTKPKAFVVQKIDIIALDHRRTMIKGLIREHVPDATIFEVSTEPGRDSDDPEAIRQWALKNMPEAKAPLYDPEFSTPHTTRELAVEFVREKCFENLEQEIPFGIAVRIMKYEETGDLDKITAEILVSRESHKAIVIGKGATKIKEIGTQARKAMEKAFDRKIFLELHVSVQEGWEKNPRLMKEFGYVVE
ncbi:MAG: GTPase Era [Bdellovibrionaceae bacterium]|nr:GTPase Era [Pseudobdellovibrionaceae bacterium]